MRLPRSRTVKLAWLAAYAAWIALIIGGILYGRGQALAIYGSGVAQAQWDEWRENAKSMTSDQSPVQRRVPKSAEPPALVLMRDYFAVCLIGAVLLSTVLFGTFMFFIQGALASPSADHPIPDSRPPHA
jgi:hypothetical protein